jgi:hypothetical protein
LRGHVTGIRWRASDDLAARITTVAEEQQLPSRAEEVDLPGKILAGQMLSLTRACTIGFLAVLALILFGYFLR